VKTVIFAVPDIRANNNLHENVEQISYDGTYKETPKQAGR
jgi:hypothetical protein